MTQIHPCRTMISDRFPVASFIVQVAPERVFEVACATDPTLFAPGHRHRRTNRNFFTSRAEGLMRAPAGEATWLLPGEQLRRFAGAHRIYYAVGTYGSPRGDGAEFTVDPQQPEFIPFVRMEPEFTGRNLDRARLGGAAQPDRYGASGEPPAWGPDFAAPQERLGSAVAAAEGYDDGFDPGLWREGAAAATQDAYAGAQEPPGFEDGVAARAAYGGALPGDEEEPAETQTLADEEEEAQGLAAEDEPEDGGYGGARYGGVPEPEGYEDPTALRAAGAYGNPISIEDVSRSRFGGDAEDEAMAAAPAFDDEAELAAIQPVAEGAAFQEGYADEDVVLALSAPAVPAAPAPLPLTIADKMRIVGAVATVESGARRYASLLRDVEFQTPGHPAHQRHHVGLSWGILHFSQRSGDLGRVLEAARRRAPDVYARIFGSFADALIAVTRADNVDARLAPVDGATLWEDRWVRRFEAAAEEPSFQHAQNEVAVLHLLDPLLPVARWLGLVTDRAMAVLLDRTRQMGRGGGVRFVVEAAALVGNEAHLRAALALVEAPTMEAFLQRCRTELPAEEARLLPAGPGVTAMGLACLIGNARQRNPSFAPPLPVLLDRIRAAAAGRPFEPRLRAVLDSRALNDTPFAF